MSKKNPNTPFFKKANTKAYLICALLFAAYIGYNEFLGPDEVTVAFEDLKSRLPLNVDAHTVLEKAYENYEGIFLEIKKSGDEFEQGSDEEKLSHLEDYAKRASSLCKNELFGKYVRSGKVLHVLLKVDEGRLKRTIAIDSCPVPSSPR